MKMKFSSFSSEKKARIEIFRNSNSTKKQNEQTQALKSCKIVLYYIIFFLKHSTQF